MATQPVMRNMLHSYGKRAIVVGLLAGVGTTVGFYFGYVQRRQRKYEEFFKNYDPYERMREICAHGKGYMHTCPKELAKLYEEKGKKIAPLN
uniref:Mitochondrial cytochrome c oxidase subunit VIc/VIIs domain-containing protein n=1 Tax=Parascaris univalens TaxID=6257 RepID=A0A915BU19_PARUN